MSVDSQNVLDYPNNNTIFMVWNFKKNVTLEATFKKLCSLLINLNNSATIRFPESKASIITGIGYDAWVSLNLPQPVPKELVSFEPVIGSKHTAVATRGDLHFHIRSTEYSFCIDAAAVISALLADIGDSVEEIHGFRYWDSRSILGFVDGTENPHGDDRAHFGIISEDEDPFYKGGSYLFVQKYLHDLKAWKSLPVSEQEKIIGRSKVDDIEMSDEVKPSNSHSALANVGDDLKIVRDNMPFGTMSTNEMGTYFIAYASLFSTIQKMLTNMFVGSPKDNYDRILDFSTAKTGSLFFVPTFDMLSEFAD
jgi:putative iron-dependent peroxidase